MARQWKVLAVTSGLNNRDLCARARRIQCALLIDLIAKEVSSILVLDVPNGEHQNSKEARQHGLQYIPSFDNLQPEAPMV